MYFHIFICIFYCIFAYLKKYIFCIFCLLFTYHSYNMTYYFAYYFAYFAYYLSCIFYIFYILAYFVYHTYICQQSSLDVSPSLLPLLLVSSCEGLAVYVPPPTTIATGMGSITGSSWKIG